MKSTLLPMGKQAATIAFFVVVAFYYFWRFRSLHLLLSQRVNKPRIGVKRGFEAVIALIAVTLFWKWVIGFPWSVAMVFALILAAGVAIIGLAYYLIYWRDR